MNVVGPQRVGRGRQKQALIKNQVHSLSVRPVSPEAVTLK